MLILRHCSWESSCSMLFAIGVNSSHSNPWLMCFAMQTMRNLWNPSIFPLLCGLYGGKWIDISVPSLVTTSLKSLFLNSVLLSFKIFTLPPKGQAMCFLYAVTTSFAIFVFYGVHHVNPVSIQLMQNGGHV